MIFSLPGSSREGCCKPPFRRKLTILEKIA